MKGKIVKTGEKRFEILGEGFEQELRESFWKGLGIVMTALKAKDLLTKRDEFWNQSGMKQGDKVMKVEVDAWKQRHEYEGKIVMKGSVPHVIIEKGRIGQGTVVKWTPNWIPSK